MADTEVQINTTPSNEEVEKLLQEQAKIEAENRERLNRVMNKLKSFMSKIIVEEGVEIVPVIVRQYLHRTDTEIGTFEYLEATKEKIEVAKKVLGLEKKNKKKA
jgi:hypothetical protein